MPGSLLDQEATDAVVLSCIDFRFVPVLSDALLRAYRIRSFDLIQLAGGAKNLASPDGEERLKVSLDDLALSIAAHHAREILVLNHQGCGKYAQAGHVFPDIVQERGFHTQELMRAAERVRREFPNVPVHAGFLFVNPDDQVEIEKVVV